MVMTLTQRVDAVDGKIEEVKSRLTTIEEKLNNPEAAIGRAVAVAVNRTMADAQKAMTE